MQYTQYAKVIDGVIEKIRSRPNWLNAATGQPLTDAELLEHDYYPGEKIRPTHDPKRETVQALPKDQWLITPSKVTVTYTVVPIPFERHKARVLADIHSKANQELVPFTAGYSQIERDTWPTQQLEAEAHRKDSSVRTPCCDAIAAERGIPRLEFLARVVEKVDVYKLASAKVRSEERRVGKEWVSKCRSRGSPFQ